MAQNVDAMEARKRFGAAVAAVVLVLASLWWGLYVLVVFTYWYGPYCEDSSIPCRAGEPVGASIQAAAAAPGLAALYLLVWRATRYARTGSPLRWRWPAFVLVAAAVGWFALAGALGHVDAYFR
jgi:hypothetical protein